MTLLLLSRDSSSADVSPATPALDLLAVEEVKGHQGVDWHSYPTTTIFGMFVMVKEAVILEDR